MSPPSKWIPLTLTLTVFPGMGHFYLRQRFKGALFALFALAVLLGGLARYISVLFALANIRPPKPPLLKWALGLMGEALWIDRQVLLTFGILILLAWAIAAFDVWWALRERNQI